MTVSANMADSALRLSAVVNRGSRAGRPDFAELSPGASRFLMDATAKGLELVQVRPENIPGLSATSHVFWYMDPWNSSDVFLTLLFGMAPEARGLKAGVGEADKPYWTFPADYPDRLPGVIVRAEAQLAAAAPPSG